MINPGNYQGRYREWGIRIGILLAAALWLAIVAVSWAEDASAANSPASSEDEYNFSWLDPEKKIYVLQNRKYRKAGHAMMSILGGTGFSNSYRSTLNYDGRLAYYFFEYLGVEAFYVGTLNSENSTFKALKTAAPTTLPSVREIRGQYGLLAHWSPWYAKINVFNKILYFDWYFSGGVGAINAALDKRTDSAKAADYVNENLFGIFLGTGHQFHLSQNWSVRLDFMSTIYNAKILYTQEDKAWFSNYGFDVGIGFRL